MRVVGTVLECSPVVKIVVDSLDQNSFLDIQPPGMMHLVAVLVTVVESIAVLNVELASYLVESLDRSFCLDSRRQAGQAVGERNGVDELIVALGIAMVVCGLDCMAVDRRGLYIRMEAGRVVPRQYRIELCYLLVPGT